MYGKIKEHLQQRTCRNRGCRGYTNGTGHRIAAACEIEVAGRKGAKLLRQQLPRTFGQSAADRGRETNHGQPRLRHVVGAFHLRLPGHPQTARKRPFADYFGTEDDSLRRLFRRQRRRLRTDFRRGGRIISDSLNHASIIDGVRFLRPCATVTPTPTWPNWGECLKKGCRPSVSASSALDGVFSMDGNAAPLDQICALAEKIRRAGDGRRVPLGGRAGRNGPRHHRTLRPARAGGHPHGYARQGIRRRRRRIHHRPQGDHRHAAPAFAPLPLLNSLPPPWSAPGSRC